MLRYPIVLLWLCGLALGAWHFDEDASHYVSVADNAALTLPDADFSMGGWLKLDDNDGSYYQYVVSWNYASLPRMEWLLGEDNASATYIDKFAVRIYDAQGDWFDLITTGTPAESTDWQHLLFVRSGAGVFTIYVNGVQDGTVTDDTVDGCDAADAMEFGRRDDGNADRAFGGALAEWAKWDRALNAEERSALAQGFSPRYFPTGLKWYMPMVRSYQELLVPLTATNVSSTVVDHCRVLP